MESLSPSHFLHELLETSCEGVLACNHHGDITYMNRNAKEIFERNDIRLYHKDGQTVLPSSEFPLARALRGEKVRDLEVLITREGSETIFALFNGHAIFDEKGDKIGAAVIFRDVTEGRKYEHRFRNIFEQAPVSMQLLSPDGKTKLVNAAWKKLWGIPEEIIENYILKDYNILEDPVLSDNGVLPYLKKGFAGELTVQPTIYYDPRRNNLTGTPRWVDAIISPLKDSTGKVSEVVLIHIDVTQEQRTIRAQEFLSRISSILISTLDYEHMIEILAETIVGHFADACIIDLVVGDKIVRPVSRHSSPEKQKLMDELHAKFHPEINSDQPTIVAIRNKAPLIFPKITPALIRKYTKNQEHAEICIQMSLRSGIAVPLEKGGKIIGAMSLMITDSDYEYDEFDLRTAQDLGRNTTMAFENARLYQDVKKALTQRDEFISIVSHELKTPITSLKLQMQMASRMASKIGTSTIGIDYVKNLTQNSNAQLDRLSRLVEDLLDISRISSGKLAIRLEKVNLSKLTQEVLARFLDHFNELGIKTCFEIEDDLYYTCDPFRMEQVITNLLSNAIRYGENRPVKVSLKNEGNRFLFQVEDHGRGIAQDDIDRIFNRFERAISTHDVRGMGLGLYITRQIVLAHHDEIHVKSEPGKGTTFTVELKNL